MSETNIDNNENNKLKLLQMEKNKTIKKKRCFHCKKKHIYVIMCKC